MLLVKSVVLASAFFVLFGMTSPAWAHSVSASGLRNCPVGMAAYNCPSINLTSLSEMMTLVYIMSALAPAAFLLWLHWYWQRTKGFRVISKRF